MNVAWAIPILLLLLALTWGWDVVWDSDDEEERGATPDPSPETETPDPSGLSGAWVDKVGTWMGKMGTVILLLVAAATLEIGSGFLVGPVLDPVLEQILPSEETAAPCVDLSGFEVDSPTAAAPSAPVDPRAREAALELLRQLGEPCEGQSWP